VALIGRNLNDRKVIVTGLDSPLGGQSGNPPAINGELARPREILLQIRSKF
jgi:hypothetical protein